MQSPRKGTFDHFAEGFMKIKCCICFEERWLSLKSLLEGSPPLVKKMHTMHFATDPLEGETLFKVRQDPGPDGFDEFYEFDRPEDLDCLLGAGKRAHPALIHNVLFDIMSLAPHVQIEIDFGHSDILRHAGTTPHRDVLFAIATTGCKVHSLWLTRESIEGIEDLTTFLGYRLLQSTSSLQDFSFDCCYQDFDDTNERDFDNKQLDLVEGILRNAHDAIDLTLDLRSLAKLPNPMRFMEKLLFVSNLTQIVSLTLEAATASEEQLGRALTMCSCTLKRLELRELRFQHPLDGWTSVIRKISTMPELEFLNLYQLTSSWTTAMTDNWVLDFSHVPNGRKKQCNDFWSGTGATLTIGITFCGRDDVVLGTPALASTPLTRVHFPF